MDKAGTAAIIILAGPTASGKSALALRLADRFGGEIVNADSMQVYRELRVLTARPTPEDEARVPHHLYGFLSVRETCSAAEWAARARAVIAEITARGCIAFVIGGTGLYLKALLDGLSPIPEVPADVRATARARVRDEGSAALHAELARLDPEAAARIAPSDAQRVARAWEVAIATGRPLSDWQKMVPTGGLLAQAPAPVHRFVLVPPRALLYERCTARLENMVEAGALDEVQALDALNLPADAPAMKALGVAQLRAHLRGEIDLADALAAAATATRRFAKRQMTWFRHQFGDWQMVEQQDLESFFNYFLSFIRDTVLTEQDL